MPARFPIEFWSAALIPAVGMLAYRVRRRRISNRSAAPAAKRFGLSEAWPQSLAGTADAGFLVPWAVQQWRVDFHFSALQESSSLQTLPLELAPGRLILDYRAFASASMHVLAAPAAATALAPVATTTAANEPAPETQPTPADRLRERMLKAVAPRPSPFPALKAPPPRPAGDRRFKTVAEMFEWLPGNSDPDTWHLLVGNLDFSDEDSLKIVEWIVDRPYCDRATAALALIRSSPEACMQFATMEACEGLDRRRWAIAQKVCERSEAGTYLSSDFNLACVHRKDDQSGALHSLQRRATELAGIRKVSPWPLPERLFAEPFRGRNAVSKEYELLAPKRSANDDAPEASEEKAAA